MTRPPDAWRNTFAEVPSGKKPGHFPKTKRCSECGRRHYGKETVCLACDTKIVAAAEAAAIEAGRTKKRCPSCDGVHTGTGRTCLACYGVARDRRAQASMDRRRAELVAREANIIADHFGMSYEGNEELLMSLVDKLWEARKRRGGRKST